MKICYLCKKFKELHLFHKNKAMGDGFNNRCKRYMSEYRKKRYHAVGKLIEKEQKLQWYAANKEQELRVARERRNLHPDKSTARCARRRAAKVGPC